MGEDEAWDAARGVLRGMSPDDVKFAHLVFMEPDLWSEDLRAVLGWVHR